MIDLISGEYNGKVHLYLNVGTAKDPVLTGAGYVKVGNSDISVTRYSVPTTADWNGDGLFDLLVGGYDGRVWLFINDGTVSSPHFSTTQYVQDSGVDLDVGSSSAPSVDDLNGDGLIDLIVGNSAGSVYYYRNTGMMSSPSFSGYEVLATSGEPIDTFSYARPNAVDWNNDGDTDIVVGQRYGVPTLHLNDSTTVLLPDLELQLIGTGLIYPQGGTISFKIIAGNPHKTAITTDFFTTVQSPELGFWGPVMNYQNVTLPPGSVHIANKSFYVPASVPTGSYYYFAYFGTSADWIFTKRDYFNFYKM